MNTEIKVCLEGTADYQKLCEALESHFIGEESYRDYFLDFPSLQLTECGSALRLRVACEKPDSVASPCAPAPAPVHAPFSLQQQQYQGQEGQQESATQDYTSSYEAYLNSWPSTSALDERLQQRQTAGLQGSQQGTGEWAPEALPQSTRGVLAGATGKLVFKQRNTVEMGHQMNFVVEDKAVPANVVMELLAGRTNPFEVLQAYAAQSGGGEESPAARIVERLQRLADAEAAAAAENLEHHQQQRNHNNNNNSASSNADSDRYFSQLRFASGAASAGPTQTGHAPCDLISMGSYTTTRRTFRYLERRGGGGASSSSSALLLLAPSVEEDTAIRDALRIRVDRTMYPFGEKYEVEVPQIDIPLDDVMEELRHFFGALQLHYQPGSEGKYHRFITGMKNLHVRPVDVQDVKLRLSTVHGYHEVRRNLESIATEVTTAERAHGVSNTELQPGGGPGGEAEPQCVQEWQDNFFFDGPGEPLEAQRCFLRLRRSRFGHTSGAKYKLVLKEKQTFSNGQQASRTSKTDVSEDVAQQLLRAPGAFLATQHEFNSVANTLWCAFGLRDLRLTAQFTTERLSVPWASSRAQVPTDHGVTASQLPPGVAFVRPLRLHLDRSQYTVRSAHPLSALVTMTQQQQPVEANPETGEYVFELYELEVADLLPETPPAAVMEELTDVLSRMGVEWSTGVQSKLQQYRALVEAANTVNAEGAAYNINRGFSQYKNAQS